MGTYSIYFCRGIRNIFGGYTYQALLIQGIFFFFFFQPKNIDIFYHKNMLWVLISNQ